MTQPGAPIEIRRMSATDLAFVLRIADSLPQAPHWPASAYVQAMAPQASPPRVALVAADVLTGMAVGFVIVRLTPPEAELETVAVSPISQRQSIGSILLLHLVHELQERQVGLLHLEVRASNRAALAFYRSNGFAQVGRRPGYYAEPKEDAILMTLKLNPRPGVAPGGSRKAANDSKWGPA